MIMKKIAFLLLVALLSTTTITAQKTVVSKKQSKEVVFDIVEQDFDEQLRDC